MPDQSRPATGGTDDRVVIVSACSSAFFEYYLDLIESLDDVGLGQRVTLGLIDLGLEAGQRRLLEQRDVRITAARWPIEPPAAFAGLEYFGFVAKPFLRELFPGYQIYLWLDADMWVQDAIFFADLCAAAATGRFAVASEADRDYRAPTLKLRLWMVNNYRRGYGLAEALRLSFAPIVNNSLAAAHVDAPHWAIWQRDYRQLVRRARRLVAMDQLSLQRALFSEALPVALLPATDDWVCSRALPAWDRHTQLFVTPGRRWSAEPHRVISVMHLTTPTRGASFAIRDTRGGVTQRYLHRPGGHVARLIEAGVRPRLVTTSARRAGTTTGPDRSAGPSVGSLDAGRPAESVRPRSAGARPSAHGAAATSAALQAPVASQAAAASDPDRTLPVQANRPGETLAAAPKRRLRSVRPSPLADGRHLDRPARKARPGKRAGAGSSTP